MVNASTFAGHHMPSSEQNYEDYKVRILTTFFAKKGIVYDHDEQAFEELREKDPGAFDHGSKGKPCHNRQRETAGGVR